MIPFNVPCFTGKEELYISQVIKNKKFSGDGEFTLKCHQWFNSTLGCKKSLLTTSGTHSLEMAAMLANIQPGDEVIMPSFTFTSTANAFVLRGAKIVFVDIRPDTMNIDEKLIEATITEKTKAIVPVHYAGVACEMDIIMEIARRHNLLVIEDAAQAILSTYKGRPLGTIGHFGCLSFHETKNIHCGEGGALLINDENYIECAEIIREKGTNRSRFWRGEIDKYSWVDQGSSYLPSELNAAFLFAQLEQSVDIIQDRINSFNCYYQGFLDLENQNKIELPSAQSILYAKSNGHIFYLKTADIEERSRLMKYLNHYKVSSVFHYIPLHSSQAGLKFGTFAGYDIYTTKDSERLLRLPLYYGIDYDTQLYIINIVAKFYTE